MAKQRNNIFVIGVDVGTGSVRAGIFTLQGEMVAHASREIRVWRPNEDFVEQSSDDIWNAASASVRQAMKEGNIDPFAVVGIAFDATCSLVALDDKDKPVSVSPSGNPDQNIIVWMDHRAVEQAGRINATKHPALKYVGGKISAEMEPPKLLWLKENLPVSWKNAARFFDLADFMTYRATGIDIRSLCTTVCKWTYLGKEGKWDPTFFRKVRLQELLASNKIGTKILPMGSEAGNLTERAAADFGLSIHTKTAVGIIDAHAGGIGVLGMGFRTTPKQKDFEKVLALIGGTSSCHMAVSREPKFIPGIWGPYYSAMIPGMWLTEGGQSATGSLLDHIIRDSVQYQRVISKAAEEGLSVYSYLNNIILDLKKSEKKGPEITRDINILPYFLGNRSPHADPTLKGGINGLTLDESVESIARIYYATIQAIAYGTRHIIEEMNKHGYHIRKIHACGGGTKNPLWIQEHADITSCEIVLPKEPEAVMLGSAMLAAVAAGIYESIPEAAVKMSAVGERYLPNRKTEQYHRAKYKVFHEMYNDFLKYRTMLKKFE